MLLSIPIEDFTVGVGRDLEEPSVPFSDDLSRTEKKENTEREKYAGIDDRILWGRVKRDNFGDNGRKRKKEERLSDGCSSLELAISQHRIMYRWQRRSWELHI